MYLSLGRCLDFFFILSLSVNWVEFHVSPNRERGQSKQWNMKIYEKLVYNEEKIIPIEQKDWITNWCSSILDKVDFKTANWLYSLLRNRPGRIRKTFWDHETHE